MIDGFLNLETREHLGERILLVFLNFESFRILKNLQMIKNNKPVFNNMICKLKAGTLRLKYGAFFT